MIPVNLKGYKVAEISFRNKHDNGFKTELDKKVSYMVRYAQNNTCNGELTAELFDKNNPDKFGIKLVMNGIFEFDQSLIKEKVHVLTFKEIFPLAKSIIATVSVNAGLPPMILPNVDIESETICRYDPNMFKGE